MESEEATCDMVILQNRIEGYLADHPGDGSQANACGVVDIFLTSSVCKKEHKIIYSHMENS